MANKRAARKAVLQAWRRSAQNSVVKSRLRTLARRLRAAVADGTGAVQQAARDYVSALDKAVKTNVIHGNSADRRKSACAKFTVV
ncbi:MAG: 30S ribosomal protein S20 [Puniceicoccales bacterium]|jgi:small subunit ribosomal protein S20|nr:30S ribosomal protein S20 [Puniceicoccales bacterium]